jgi:hypothetical protein
MALLTKNEFFGPDLLIFDINWQKLGFSIIFDAERNGQDKFKVKGFFIF